MYCGLLCKEIESLQIYHVLTYGMCLAITLDKNDKLDTGL